VTSCTSSIASAGLSPRGWSTILIITSSSPAALICISDPIFGGLPVTPRSSFDVPSFRWMRNAKLFSTYFIFSSRGGCMRSPALAGGGPGFISSDAAADGGGGLISAALL
jgi:hypothetical protein